MSKKTKNVAAARPAAVPTSLNAVEALETGLADLMAAIEAHKTEAASEVARINADLEAQIKPLKSRALEMAAQVYAYADAHRSELTDAGKTKTARLGNAGRVEWATSPAAVSIRKADDVLAALQKLGLDDFIRHPPAEIDKDAMLKDQERAKTVPGVTISQAEKVYVRPASSRAHVEATIGKKGKPGVWTIVWPKDEEKGE